MYRTIALIIALIFFSALLTGYPSTGQQATVVPPLAVLESNTVASIDTVSLKHLLPPSDTRLSIIPLTVTVTPLPACDVVAWWETVDPTVVQFLDTWEVASVTSQVSLSPILLELRQVWRQFERADYPECAKFIRDNLVAAMSDTAEGFNEFLAERDDATFLLQRAALRFRATGQILAEYSINPDIRLTSLVYEWGGVPRAATATWIFMSYSERVDASSATAVALSTINSRLATDVASTRAARVTPSPTTTPVARVVAEVVSLRSCPEKSCSTAGVLIQDDLVVVLDTVQGEEISGNNTWYLVRFRNQEGYVHSSTLNTR